MSSQSSQSFSIQIILAFIRFLYWLDRKLWRPAGLANCLYEWLEVRGLCCEKHAKAARSKKAVA